MPPTADREPVDVVIVGAGLAGLYMLHRVRGLGLTVRVFEAGDDVGGTWYWNRYPGARCDVPSLEYSYSFDPELEQEWEWSERYATQPEILRYIEHVADRYDLRRDITFGTRVVSAVRDDEANSWRIATDTGEQVACTWLVTAAGCLSAPKPPEIPGVETFAGPIWSTSNWPADGVDLTGLRVGVVGTGSSGIQSIPVIAEQAASLTVFQRTPNYSLPARNAPLDPEYQREWKARYREHRAAVLQMRTGILIERGTQSALAVDPDERTRRFEHCWDTGLFACIPASYPDITTDLAANETAAEFVRAKIRATVRDPEVAEALTPRGYPFGTKRICLDSGYYETFNRDTVSLVDLRRTPIVEVTPRGIRTTEAEHEFDALVFATGFDAVTGPLLRMGIRGRDGVDLRERWADGPRSYLGLQVAGFPNLFTITGPGSPSVVSNVIVSIEQHVDWIAECLRYLREHDIATIEPDLDAEDAWVQHVHDVAALTLYPQAPSWFVGANVPGKPRVFMPYLGGVPAYRQRCAEVAAAGYNGFRLDRRTVPA
ncbi:flavin-containing monooxygenase [Geodermatophilus sp. CPCC 206100]|uniref:flavin-containing monooxygenase n=1 Tax=Geodermatophilus sp. CPCC 206100 TaxID=3020054 RepID=UPI003B008F2C